MNKEKFGKKDIFATAVKEIKEPKENREKPSVRFANSENKPLFNPDPSIKESKTPDTHKTIIHSFRIREDLLERVREYSFFERVNIYNVINNALEKFLKDYQPNYSSRSQE